MFPEFVFEENKNTEPTFSDMLAQKSDQGTDISSVYDITVSQKAQSVNTSISENAENDTKNIAPVKNSLSEQGEQATNGTPLNELYYKDIPPVKDTVQTEQQYEEDISPITESNIPITEEANARKSYIIEYKAGEFVLESGEVKLHFEYINNTLNKYRICQILIQGVVF